METGGIRMHKIETKVYHADLDTDLIAFGENKCDAIWKKKKKTITDSLIDTHHQA